MKMKLSDLNIDDGFIVDKIETDGEIRQRIIEMGFTPGSTGWIVRKAPLGDPIQVRIMDYDVSLRKTEALGISVIKTEIPQKIFTSDDKVKEMKSEDADYIKKVSTKKNESNNIDKSKPIVVAIAGNPNAGKTTIFNALTGLNYKVANYAGVTVEKKETVIEHNGQKYKIIDLPGIYSLSAYSQDEVIACNYILHEKPDYIIDVLDATNLERNLYLTLQLTELNIPVICALNMYEKAEKSGINIREKKLSELMNFPFIKIHGDQHSSVVELLNKVEQIQNGDEIYIKDNAIVKYNEYIEKAIEEIVSSMKGDVDKYYKRWLAIKSLEKDERAFLYIRKAFETSSSTIIDTIAKASKNLEENSNNDKTDSIIANGRYSYIRGALAQTIIKEKIAAFNFTDAADIVFLNKFLGLPIFVVVLWLIFQATFTLGAYPQEWLDMGVVALASFVGGILPEGFINSIIVDGIIGGVGSVLSFLPLVLILFLGISFLEDSGYMARAAFLMDRIMKKLGLHGQSFIPLFIGFGCTIPAVMGARALRNKKDRIVTILISTFMSCGARIPVYVLIISAFFAPEVGANIMLSLYLIGIVVAFIMAFVFRRVFFKGEETPFVMELPPYRIPRITTILRHMLDRMFMYIKRAGTYVLAASILIWILITFPSYNPNEVETQNLMNEAKIIVMEKSIDINDEEALANEYALLLSQESLRNSYAGMTGRFIEPVIRPLGFDWRIGIALVAGGAAKEIVVSTIAQIKGVEDGNEESLVESLQSDPAFNPIVAYSLLLFVLLYIPCFAAVGVIGSELGNKWMVFVIFYTVALAWVVSFIFYQIASRIFL